MLLKAVPYPVTCRAVIPWGRDTKTGAQLAGFETLGQGFGEDTEILNTHCVALLLSYIRKAKTYDQV